MRKALQIVLTAAALGWLAVCLFLSWQTGAKTVGLSWRIARWLHGILQDFGISWGLTSLHRRLRLLAHVGIFFVEGFLAAAAVGASHTRRKGLGMALTALFVAGAAVLAEVCKINIPGRHLQWDETGLDVLGGVAGVLLAAAGLWIFRRLRARVLGVEKSPRI